MLASPVAYGQVSFFTPPTYAGSGALFVADFNGDGKLDLLSGDGTLQLGGGDGTFTSGSSVAGAPMAVADFNADGKADVLEQANNSLVVLLGNGDGTFQAPVTTVIGATLQPILAVDLNGDGKADVVGVFGNTLFVFLSNGNGTFGVGTPFSLGVNPAAAPGVCIGDFNGDKKLDLATFVGQANTSSSELAVFVGNGDGSLQSPKTSVIPLLDAGCSAIGDFNSDSKIDLAVTAEDPVGTSSSTWILFGNGDATFQTPVKAFSGAGDLATTDVNGDGRADLIVYSIPLVQVYLGRGDGSFSTPDTYMTGLNPTGANSELAIADFNHDGKTDVAAGNFVLLGRGDGTLQGQPAVAVGTSLAPSISSVPADFNNDGRPDQAVITQSPTHGFENVVNILLADGSGGMILSNSYTLQQTTNVRSIGIADVNQDGKLDLVVVGDANDGSGTNNWVLLVLLGDGDGSFGAPASYDLGTVPAGPAILADFNNDRKLDLAVPQSNGSMAILISNGDGTFKLPVYYSCPATVLIAADFNGDGNIDVAGGDSGGMQTALLFGNGDGTFRPATFPLGTFTAHLTADLNNDGKADLIGESGNGNEIQVLLGNGDGTFTPLNPWIPPCCGFPHIQLADLNGDDQLDAMVQSHGRTPQTGVYLGNGDGTFSSFVPVFGENVIGGEFIQIADINQDGKPDLIFGESSTTPGAFVLFNTTSRTVGNIGLAIAQGASNSQTVQAGSSATYNLSVGGRGWTGQVMLSCTGLPSNATCSFPGGATAKVQGGAVSNFTLVIATGGTTTAVLHDSRNLWLMAFGLISIVSFPFAPRTRGKMCSLAIIILTLCSCGGGSSPSSPGTPAQIGTPSGTYTVTVNATAGSVSQSLPIVLTVK